MNGRIEREPISITESRDGGASLAELRDRRQDVSSWRSFVSVAGAWCCMGWFASMAVRGREVAGWEIAGLITGLIVVASVARKPGQGRGR